MNMISWYSQVIVSMQLAILRKQRKKSTIVIRLLAIFSTFVSDICRNSQNGSTRLQIWYSTVRLGHIPDNSPRWIISSPTRRMSMIDCYHFVDMRVRSSIHRRMWWVLLRRVWQMVSESVNLWICESAYFLSFARLSPPKRVDLIVDAFLQMPDQNLIFTYGRNDPMRDEILAKIEWKGNIRAIESPNDTDLISLIQWATATIYIPVDEDFGMSPVESMACGTPVIGVNEGGLRETIVQNETGRLIQILDSESGIQSLKQVIQNTSKEEWESMSDACIVRSRDFSLDAFEKKLKSSLQL